MKPQILNNEDFLRKLKAASVLVGGVDGIISEEFERIVRLLDSNGIKFSFTLHIENAEEEI